MNLESTLTWPLSCPKDGVHLCAEVDHWQNSSQRHRWLATALLDIEPRLRKVMGYRQPAQAS